MLIGSKDLAITELDTFEDERLAEELKKAKAELFNLRSQSATGQLRATAAVVVRGERDIARIYTVLREREHLAQHLQTQSQNKSHHKLSFHLLKLGQELRDIVEKQNRNHPF